MCAGGCCHGEPIESYRHPNARNIHEGGASQPRYHSRYIGKENPAVANRVAVQIVAACDRLEYRPERGRPGLVAGTRELVALWPYVIVYRITSVAVEIVNLWRGAQDR